MKLCGIVGGGHYDCAPPTRETEAHTHLRSWDSGFGSRAISNR